MIVHFQWRDYKYFPYEKEFARREVKSLFGQEPVEDKNGVSLNNGILDLDKAARLTYFSRVTLPENEIVVPMQAQLEGSAAAPKTRRRQATRYSAHALHEYKGRYNPQVVRAIGNMIGLEPKSWVLDPFSGSGTTLVESAHVGWNAVGIDLNPLAVKITRAKIAALKTNPNELLKCWRRVRVRLLGHLDGLSHTSEVPESELTRYLGTEWNEELPGYDYLKSWFPTPVLAQLTAILRALDQEIAKKQVREIFEVIVSDSLREVSLQEPADLRVRRRRNPQPNYPLLHRFFESTVRSLESIERARRVAGSFGLSQTAYLGDVRTDTALLREVAPNDGFNAIISSPPYVSALPYVDTQRLSLVALGLLEPAQLRDVESDLIGAREITTSTRREIEERIETHQECLPWEIVALCRTLLNAARLPGNGFRRKNRPALVYQYFVGMSRFFSAVLPTLKHQAAIALVVGSNRTTLGGQEFLIDTPMLLAELATYCGCQGVQLLPMDTYQRYNLHSKNSINSEKLLIAYAPG